MEMTARYPSGSPEDGRAQRQGFEDANGGAGLLRGLPPSWSGLPPALPVNRISGQLPRTLPSAPEALPCSFLRCKSVVQAVTSWILPGEVRQRRWTAKSFVQPYFSCQQMGMRGVCTSRCDCKVERINGTKVLV